MWSRAERGVTFCPSLELLVVLSSRFGVLEPLKRRTLAEAPAVPLRRPRPGEPELERVREEKEPRRLQVESPASVVHPSPSRFLILLR